MRRAMAKAGLEPPIHVAENGQDAVDYLSGAGRYADRQSFPVPLCIFLDLKLPFIQGFEVLTWVRAQPELKEVSVIILTASPEESDRRLAAELGAKGYLVNPRPRTCCWRRCVPSPNACPWRSPANLFMGVRRLSWFSVGAAPMRRPSRTLPCAGCA